MTCILPVPSTAIFVNLVSSLNNSVHSEAHRLQVRSVLMLDGDVNRHKRLWDRWGHGDGVSASESRIQVGAEQRTPHRYSNPVLVKSVHGRSAIRKACRKL